MDIPLIIADCTIDDINLIAGWLSCDPSTQGKAIDADLIVLAGHAVVPAIFGVMKLAAETGLPLLFTGGVGHSTELLRHALAEAPLTRNASFDQPAEADIFYSLATEFFSLPPAQLYVENRSANCGQNAEFTRNMIMAQGIPAARILLSQDPLMQRRTYETFKFSWRAKTLPVNFQNWSVFVPQLCRIGDSVTITGAQTSGILPSDRFLSMLLGEMRRLNDDASGYGPDGAGFIDHVDIPQQIREAWDRVRTCEQFVGLSRA